MPPLQAYSDATPSLYLRRKGPKDNKSLWRISWHLLGDGQRYRQIFAANASQIRDPKLIYPGQIFVVPQERATP